MKPLLQDRHHRNLAFWGMAMIAMGLPLSVFLVSVGVFVLAGNWFLEGHHGKRLQQFFTSPLSLAISSIFFVHCLGLIWTEDFTQGLKDLRIKLPLLVLPLVLFTSKLPDKKRIEDVLKLFVVACVVGSVFGLAKYVELTGELSNSRHISVFISHIRFGLMIVLAFFILAYLLYSKRELWSIAEKLTCALTMIWLLVFLIILEAFTGYLAFIVVSLVASLGFLFKNGRVGAYVALAFACLLVASGMYVRGIAVNHFHEVPFDYRTLTVKTLNGNLYAHQKDILYRENGHRVWNLVCLEELRKEWPTRSSMNFEGKDARGQELRFTIIRYLTSMGLPKDSAAIHQLDDRDIENIEAGHTNFRYTDRFGFARRVDEILWACDEYRWKQNANNSSALQRLVYFEVGLKIFMENPLWGVGTGDIFRAYERAYDEDDEGLEKKFQNISHNQILTVGITLGAFGLLFLSIAILYPLMRYRSDLLFLCFMALMLVSFMTDNTFDRQAGTTLFAFFNALLIIRKEFSGG